MTANQSINTVTVAANKHSPFRLTSADTREVMVPVVASEQLDRAHVQGSRDKSVSWAGAFATCGGQRYPVVDHCL
jgi:hypothetical protein